MPDMSSQFASMYWTDSNPNHMRLVRVSRPFPPFLNPLFKKGVVMRAAGVPGSEARHSKWIVGREAIAYGIERGLIKQDTKIVEATSANTGDGIAETCTALGLEFYPVFNFDTPQPKVASMTIYGPHIHPLPHSDPNETTVERARKLGAQPGWFNPDQYGPGGWNWGIQKVMARQWFTQVARKPRIVVLPAGTMGSSMGAYYAAQELGLDILVVPVVVRKGHEWPGGRTLARILRDIRNGWEKLFLPEFLEDAPRYEAFNLSYQSWPFTPRPLGPSFGAALYGALHFLWKHDRAGTLDQFRDPADGKIYVDVFGPDENLLYIDIYPNVLTYEDMLRQKPVSLKQLFEAA